MTAPSVATQVAFTPALGGWVLACALAEGLGMTAASTAARAADQLPAVALLLVVLGGLVEGTALGVLQSRWLARRFPGLSRLRWVVTTVLIAGLGWSLASAPSALGGASGSVPPVGAVLAGAAGLGLVMGAVMGAAQAPVFPRSVHHRWRWVGVSAVSWAPTMVVIFAGATLPDASWPTPGIIVLGLATGLVAGAVLGLTSFLLFRTLEGPSVWGLGLSWMLRHNIGRWGRSFALLRIRGVKSGRTLEIPVQYGSNGNTAVVLVGAADQKRWWRNLLSPSAISIRIDGAWLEGTSHVVPVGTTEFSESRAIYQRKWRSIRVRDDAVLVRVDLGA